MAVWVGKRPEVAVLAIITGMARSASVITGRSTGTKTMSGEVLVGFN
jgi:hypothetical protein